MTTHRFGGDWTEEKLEMLRKYLHAYTLALSKQSWCRTMYVDAFAGTGYRVEKHQAKDKQNDKDEPALFLPEMEEPQTQAFLEGSAYIALENEPAFDHYLFIEQKAKHVRELEKLKGKFPNQQHKIQIERADANIYLQQWAAQVDWKKWRAVVFLDPYGMQVNWGTLKVLASTQAIDLWLLVPIGQAYNRVLTVNEPPPKEWAQALTRTLGTEEWREFYESKKTPTLFGEVEVVTKNIDFTGIMDFFIRRLQTIFPGVASNPRPLYNSSNTPLYWLSFAAANPRGAKLACKIANDILKN